VTRKRTLALVAVILLLVAAVDFRQRIYVPREYKARGEGSLVPAVVAEPRTAAQIQTDLAAWLPQMRPVAASAGPEAGSQWALTLLAVFVDRNDSFAVVRATPASGGAAKIQSVATGDSVYGLTVSRIEPLKLVLTGEGGEQQLQLFKPATAAAVGSGPSAQSSSLPSASATTATSQSGFPQTSAPAKASGPSAPSQTDATPAASQASKPGAPAQLPASMKGLKVVDEPSTIGPPEIRKGRKAKQPSKVPRKP
jgi:hypothetical protein